MKRRTFVFLGAGALASGAFARGIADQQQITPLPRPPRTPSPTPTPGGGSRVLNPLADLTYLGAMLLPNSGAMGTRFGFSNAALACRVVGNDIQFFVPQASQEVPGGNDHVALVRYTGPGTRGELVANLGDVSQGRRLAKSPNPTVVRGMYWDSFGSRLWMAYGDIYNVGGVHDPSLIQVAINGNDASGVKSFGPYRTHAHSQRTRGYIHGLPSEVVTALSGKRIGVGAPTTSGNANSPFGAWCGAFAPPADLSVADTPNDAKMSIDETTLIASDINRRNPRPADTAICGWTHYNDASVSPLPQHNTVQDGSGCNVEGKACGVFLTPPSPVFNELDMVSAAAWIDGPNVSGLVHLGQLCRTIPGVDYGPHSNGMNHKWYGPFQNPNDRPMCPHGQRDLGYLYSTGDATGTMLSTMYVTPREKLLAVAQGADPYSVTLSADGGTDMSKIPSSPGVAKLPQIAAGLFSFGGAAFCEERQLLFVSQRNAERVGSEYQAAIHVIQVTANLR